MTSAVGSPLSPPTSPLPLWPADIHVIGKDIVKFHAVYWPIMLKALGLPLPKQLLVHGWWQKDGAKISKSTGNIIDPVAVINEWGLDAFRFYVLRELDIGPDGNWTDAGFKSRYSSELANGLGNLVNRSLSMLKRYRNGVVPARSNELSADAEKVIAETQVSAGAKRIAKSVAGDLVTGHPRESIRGPHRALQTGERSGAGAATRRGFVQPDRSLPHHRRPRLAIPPGNRDENFTRNSACKANRINSPPPSGVV